MARRAHLSDADDLVRLRWAWRVVERDEKGDPDRFRQDFTDWMTLHEETHLPFVIESDGSLVGMAWLAVIDRVPGPQKWTRRSGAVQSVYVMAERRNRGLGEALMNELINGARSRGMEYLSVHPSPRSFPFYRRLGFQGEGSLLFLSLES
jgi:GNAT superfamily N-acetyltransferase